MALPKLPPVSTPKDLDSNITDMKQLFMAVFKTASTEIVSKLELLLFSKLLSDKQTPLSYTVAICIATALFRYTASYIYGKIMLMIKNRDYCLKMQTAEGGKLSKAVNFYFKQNSDTIKNVKFDILGNEDSMYLNSIYRIGIGNENGKGGFENNRSLAKDTNFNLDFKGEQIVVRKENTSGATGSVYPGPPMVKINFSSKKKDVVDEFVQSVLDNYVREKNNTSIYLIDSSAMSMANGSNGTRSKDINIEKTIDKLYLPTKLTKQVDFFVDEYQDIFNRKTSIGMSRKIGILMSGHSGCGKTSTVFALSKKLNMPIYKLMPPLISTLDRAETCIPDSSIILIDDFDSSYFEIERAKIRDEEMQQKRRKKTSEEGDKMMTPPMTLNSPTHIAESNHKTILNKLLSIFDGYYGFKNCILILTTNRPEQIEPELLRPGRIDYVFDFGKKMEPVQVWDAFESIYGEFDNALIKKYMNKIVENATMSDVMSSIATFADSSQAIQSLSEVKESRSRLKGELQADTPIAGSMNEYLPRY